MGKRLLFLFDTVMAFASSSDYYNTTSSRSFLRSHPGKLLILSGLNGKTGVHGNIFFSPLRVVRDNNFRSGTWVYPRVWRSVSFVAVV